MKNVSETGRPKPDVLLPGGAHLKEIAAALHIPLVDQARMALAAKESMVMGINDSFYVATILTVIAFALSFFIRKTKPPEDTVSNRNRTGAFRQTFDENFPKRSNVSFWIK